MYVIVKDDRMHVHVLCHLLVNILFFCIITTSFSAVEVSSSDLLVVGATGSTGLRAIQGLLDVGYKPRHIRLVTRNVHSEKSKALKKAGFRLVEADLEDVQSLQEIHITRGCIGCYVHSTSSDTAELDKGEVERAQNLASAITNERNNICHIVYNSVAAQENHGVGRITQKHDVEKIFEQAVMERRSSFNKKPLFFTSLRANIFMEELWKKYTRPQILNGVYPLPVNGSRKIYLVSVRDLGRLAGKIIQETNNKRKHSVSSNRTINVAGDYLSANDIAKTFASAQKSPCYHTNPRIMTLKAWWYFPELYEQIRFIQTFTENTDIDNLKKEFPNILTDFATFLEETQWDNKNRTFADLSSVSSLQ